MTDERKNHFDDIKYDTQKNEAPTDIVTLIIDVLLATITSLYLYWYCFIQGCW